MKISNDHRLMHSIDISDEYLNNHFSFKIDDGSISNLGMERIFKYAKNIFENVNNKSGTDAWSIISKHHSDLVNFCLNNDYENFSFLMKNIATTPLVLGFMNYYSYADLKNSNELKKIEAIQFLDKLISLSEYKGISNVLNPEQGTWHINNLDYIPFLSQCFTEAELIIPPPSSAGGAFGISTNLGIYCLKDLKSMYTANRIRDISNKEKINNINEVGAGLGFTSYYVSKLLNSNYKIYDLPTVSIMQSYFLMRSLGESAVCLEGEKPNSDTKVSLFPFWSIYDNNDEEALWVNHDSLPEIDISIARRYINKFAKTKRGFFLSINQEAQASDSVGGNQHRVSDSTKLEARLELLYRSRDFLRLGYIEELYKIID